MSQILSKSLEQLHSEVDIALSKLDYHTKLQHNIVLQEKLLLPDFWNDNQEASRIMQEIAKLESFLQPWTSLVENIQNLQELISMDDQELEEECQKELQELKLQFENQKQDLRFQGEYDNSDVILSIYAGAGGTDSMDWADMLLRMYVRFCQSQKGYNCQILEITSGEEAGIKSATIQISGAFAYGRLKGEHGVHRLVRLSPFNADNLRQTSFAKVDVMPKIEGPSNIEIDEKELKIDVYRAGGHGGQSVNTTDSAVRITHIPTGLTVAIQNERSQLQNKQLALSILASKLAILQKEQHAEKLSEIKGPNVAAEWGNQIRNYVLHPYSLVKDNRTKHQTSDVQSVLDGKLEPFIEAYTNHTFGEY